MARKSKSGSRGPSQPRVAEAAVAYESHSIVEVFWIAFQSLSQEQQGAFVNKLLDDPVWYEEIEDALSIIQARNEPTRPYEEFREELRREGRL